MKICLSLFTVSRANRKIQRKAIRKLAIILKAKIPEIGASEIRMAI